MLYNYYIGNQPTNLVTINNNYSHEFLYNILFRHFGLLSSGTE